MRHKGFVWFAEGLHILGEQQFAPAPRPIRLRGRRHRRRRPAGRGGRRRGKWDDAGPDVRRFQPSTRSATASSCATDVTPGSDPGWACSTARASSAAALARLGRLHAAQADEGHDGGRASSMHAPTKKAPRTPCWNETQRLVCRDAPASAPAAGDRVRAAALDERGQPERASWPAPACGEPRPVAQLLAARVAPTLPSIAMPIAPPTWREALIDARGDAGLGAGRPRPCRSTRPTAWSAPCRRPSGSGTARSCCRTSRRAAGDRPNRPHRGHQHADRHQRAAARPRVQPCGRRSARRPGSSSSAAASGRPPPAASSP